MSKKGLICEWPPNGVPLEARDSIPRSSASPPRVAAPSRYTHHHSSSSTPPTVDVPHTVAHAEQLDHSILNDPRGEPADGRIGPVKKRRRAFPFDDAGSRTEYMVTEELMRALPSRAEADTLLRIYIHHPLHLPTFLAQYNRFWTMDIARRCETVHARWLALLYIALCLGDHFSDEQLTTDPTLEIRLVTACEDTLSYSDFLNQPSTETIQTIICLNIYLNNKNRVTAAKSLLGTAIKMAVCMGMSRIPDEGPTSDEEGSIEREIGRRLWWSLVCQDAYTASNSGFTYSINLSHSSTGYFANVEDEEIRWGSHCYSRPMAEITCSTYHLCKINFALTVRKFIDAVNANFPDASYDDIMALDRQFRSVYDTLPVPLRPDLPQPFELSFAGSRRYLVEQRIFMGITLHNRIMRLHRSYMVRGYDDLRYAYSTKVCLESAYATLELVKQSPQTLCRWWVVMVHVWTSGLIISADLVKGVSDVVTRRQQRDGVKMAISLLEPISRTSPVASRGVKVLKALLDTDDAQVNAQKRQTANEQPMDIAQTDNAISSMADLEQLLRDVASVPTTYTAPTAEIVPDQTLEFWQSLFQMNQW
uniref:Xylanolytic transcriptional activator regulatory domain-containing protein n=1 Tax=Kwoniella bestiolae CBS 10118 TaxID=1296100 RepID=A0A1B9G6T9_9TREE|nr:hypothetical protein I302_04436 [Kwoniella bestiolae CBS 10118]OCF26748.1 hypothetical protein I302_04436 [Kwoniella bestiolae CBS 10118]